MWFFWSCELSLPSRQREDQVQSLDKKPGGMEYNAEIKWQSGVRCGVGIEVWGLVMQGVRAQDEDLGFYFSIKKKPWRGFK